MKILLFCFFLSFTLWGQEETKYQRKSITHIEGLFRLDPSANLLSESQKQSVIYSIKNSMTMGRFDFNPLPSSLLNTLQSQSRIQGVSSPEELRQLLASTLIPNLSEQLKDSSFERAQTLQSESQKQSFMAEKAKSLDITSDQYQKLLNSAYIYVPTISQVNFTRKYYTGEIGYNASLVVGVLWYQILTDEFGSTELVLLRHSTSEGFGEASGRLPHNYKEMAFQSALAKAVQNLKFETKKMDAFRLKGQVTREGFRSAQIDLGNTSGINLNQKFRIYDMVQEGDSLYRENRGWAFVHDVDEDKSEIHMVAGIAEVGQSLDEIPLVGYGIDFGYREFTWSSKFETIPPQKDWKFDSFRGIFIGPVKDLSGVWGWNHFYVGAQFGFSFASIDANLSNNGDIFELDYPLYADIQLQGRKMFHIANRFFWGLGADLGFYQLTMSLTDQSFTRDYSDISTTWYGNTIKGKVVGEFAISPNWSILGTLGQQYSSYFAQYYSIDNSEYRCEETSLPCFDIDVSSPEFSLSIEYKFERLSEAFQRMFL